jgi:hypothetical protein
VAQVVRRRPLTMEVQVLSRASPCEICGGQSNRGKRFCSNIPVLLVSLKNAAYSSWCEYFRYQKDKRAKLGNLRNYAVSDIGEFRVEKYE